MPVAQALVTFSDLSYFFEKMGRAKVSVARAPATFIQNAFCQLAVARILGISLISDTWILKFSSQI